MNSNRNSILDEILVGMNDETKTIYKVAEEICRREYEKAFKLNLDLPIGHPQNLIPFSKEHIYDIILFWESLKNKYFKKCRDPLASAIAYFCDTQTTGMYILLKKK